MVSALMALALCVVTFVTGAMRWQMAPACALALIVCFWAVVRARQTLDRHPAQKLGVTRRIGKGLAVFVLLVIFAVAGALPALFPIDFLPAPTGPHSVGTTAFEVRSRSPAPEFATDARGNRDIEVLAWYPALPGSRQPRAPFWHYPGRLGPALAKALGFPDFLFDHLRLVRSHARLDAPATDGRHPVLIFSHGLAQGMAPQNTALFEELASHGYVVMSLGHAGEALLVRLSSDRWVASDSKLLAPISTELRGQRARIESILKTTDPAEGDRLFGGLLADGPKLAASIAVWKADTLAVMNQLSEVERGIPVTPLAGHLDLQRFGLMGMSFGGAASVEACDDARCAAAVQPRWFAGREFLQRAAYQAGPVRCQRDRRQLACAAIPPCSFGLGARRGCRRDPSRFQRSALSFTGISLARRAG